MLARLAVVTPMQLSTKQQIKAVREGSLYSSFTELRNALELNTDELAQLLSIPKRTLTKRQQVGNFNPSESNALSRVARVYLNLIEVFQLNHRRRYRGLCFSFAHLISPSGAKRIASRSLNASYELVMICCSALRPSVTSTRSPSMRPNNTFCRVAFSPSTM